MNQFSGLDLLASSVIVLDRIGRVVYANPAAENLLERPSKLLLNASLRDLFLNSEELFDGFKQAIDHQFAEKRQDLILERNGRDALHVHSIVTSLDLVETPVLIELRENVQQLKLDREERMQDQNKENKELIRNLAHEIKNPLGGIRGAAQLLELELPEQDISERRAKELREYTQVIIKEADRLQVLVDRLLAPNRLPQVIADVNIHEVCERVFVASSSPSFLRASILSATTICRFLSSEATSSS